MIEGHRSGNSYRLGDTVRVAVAAVDADARSLDFRLIARAGSSGKPGRGKTVGDKRPIKPHGKSAKPDRTRHKKKSRPGKHERRARKQPKRKPGGKTKQG